MRFTQISNNPTAKSQLQRIQRSLKTVRWCLKREQKSGNSRRPNRYRIFPKGTKPTKATALLHYDGWSHDRFWSVTGNLPDSVLENINSLLAKDHT